MKLKTLAIILICLGCALVANAQTRTVKVAKFEVDGKEIKGDFKLFFEVDSKSVELTKNGNSFVVPAEIQGDVVDVRFVAGTYELNFEAVPVSKFSADWTFGVDTNPYDEANLSIETPPDPPGVELATIQYLKFDPKQGPSTRQITKTFH